MQRFYRQSRGNPCRMDDQSCEQALTAHLRNVVCGSTY